MAWCISKICIDDCNYLLPDIVNTPLWDLVDPDRRDRSKKSDRQLVGLYRAISLRENYFQENTPTAFGNPEYNLYCGIVSGFLQALEFTEEVENGQIIVRNSANRIVLVIDKLKLPQSYYDRQRENREVLSDIGLC